MRLQINVKVADIDWLGVFLFFAEIGAPQVCSNARQRGMAIGPGIASLRPCGMTKKA